MGTNQPAGCCIVRALRTFAIATHIFGHPLAHEFNPT
jgi:hypothetical protein